MTLPLPQPPPETNSDWGSALHVRALVLIGLTGALLYLCYAMFSPFMAPLAWALALAVLCVPMHRAIEARVRRPNVAALLSVSIVVVAVVLPGLLLANRLLGESASGILRGSLVQLVSLVLTFYLLFYFLRDRLALRRMLRRLTPLPADDMTRLFGDVFDTVHATVYGSLVVATVQGALGGAI